MVFKKNVLIIFTLLLSIQCFAGGKKPADVYHYNITELLPLFEAAAKSKGINDMPKYKFPKRKNKTIVPADVYSAIYSAYFKLSKKIKMDKIKKIGAADVVPSDVFKLSEQVVSVLKKISLSSVGINSKIESGYQKWKSKSRAGGKGIVPGDVRTLGKYYAKIVSKIK